MGTVYRDRVTLITPRHTQTSPCVQHIASVNNKQPSWLLSVAMHRKYRFNLVKERNNFFLLGRKPLPSTVRWVIGRLERRSYGRVSFEQVGTESLVVWWREMEAGRRLKTTIPELPAECKVRVESSPLAHIGEFPTGPDSSNAGNISQQLFF